MNKTFNYFIDFTRIGELVRSGRHRYSLKEIIVRFIIVTATLSTFAYQRCINPIVIMQSILCFSISHGIIILPLIMKRYHTYLFCTNTIKELKRTQCKCHELPKESEVQLCEICSKINTIMDAAATNDKASSTWGMRKRLLVELKMS